MARSTQTLLAVALAASALPAPSFAQGYCTSCHDYATYDGWMTSPTSCTQAKTCFSARPPLAYADLLQPGVLTEQRSGRLYVAAVVVASPASSVGLRVGDEIVSVNDVLPGTSCTEMTWDSPTSPGTTRMIVNRNGRELAFSVSLKPTAVLVAEAWKASLAGGQAVPAAVRPHDIKALMGLGPYLAGITIGRHDNDLQIVDVLPGSPAAAMDILSGDHLIAVDGVRVNEDSVSVAKLNASAQRTTFALTLLRGSRERTVHITTEGVSQLLWALADGSPTPHSLMASR